MSFDVTTLALAKSYADQHGGSGGASTAGDFIIKMTIEVNGNNYTVTSCDKTMEQIDAAVASGQNIKAIAFDKYIMPMIQMEYSESYTFGAFLDSFLVAANVAKNPESGTDNWQFYLSPITADIVEYSNAAMPRISTVEDALNELVPKSHTHSNKAILDKFAETDGKPTYDGKKISGAFTAEEVEYTNAILPDASNVKSALDDTIDTQQTQSAELESLRAGVSALIDAYQTQGGDIASLKTQAHTHTNKDTLDKLSVSNGKLQYNGSDVGLKGDKGDTGAAGADGYTPVKGTDYWTAADKAEIVADTLAALPKWTGGSY